MKWIWMEWGWIVWVLYCVRFKQFWIKCVSSVLVLAELGGIEWDFIEWVWALCVWIEWV